eukprot:247593-Chlamydomonas_euryale.AAC.3
MDWVQRQCCLRNLDPHTLKPVVWHLEPMVFITTLKLLPLTKNNSHRPSNTASSCASPPSARRFVRLQKCAYMSCG